MNGNLETTICNQIKVSFLLIAHQPDSTLEFRATPEEVGEAGGVHSARGPLKGMSRRVRGSSPSIQDGS